MIKNSFKLSVIAAVILPFTTHSVWAMSTEERLQRLERMADNPVLLQLSQRVAEQQREIQRLQDEMDRLGQTSRFAIQQSTKRYTETDERINALEEKLNNPRQTIKPQVSVPMPTVPALPKVSEPASASAEESKVDTASDGESPPSQTKLEIYPATAEENDQYQAAFALMRASKYEESIQAFETFLEKNPGSSLASNASYWAGEGHLINKDYNKALNAFNLVTERYPNSSKVPDALLRAADSLLSLKKTADARALYQKVIDNYPDTRAAKSAQKRIP
ncbi:MAG: tol-pal system protein YbgF [Thiotrichales bacterium]|nr:tol-pal system protein YbgF [Thiotrichales bacterium]